MRRPIRTARGIAAASALLAIALLSFALVQSTVMQAAAQTPWGMAPICRAQTDEGHSPNLHHGADAVCGFCAAAAHAPLLAPERALRLPVALRWIVDPPAARTAIRARPLLRANARAPPRLSDVRI